MSIMKKLPDLAHEKLINLKGGYGLWSFGHIHGYPRNSHLCTKSAKKA